MEKMELEIHKCALCYDAPCKKIYKNVDPERIIRALRFDNEKGASILINNYENFLEKNKDCLERCPNNVDIDTILKSIPKNNLTNNDLDMDITTQICGVKLENPFLLSSSVIGSNYDKCKRALEAGWAGVVYKTICPFDIRIKNIYEGK